MNRVWFPHGRGRLRAGVMKTVVGLQNAPEPISAKGRCLNQRTQADAMTAPEPISAEGAASTSELRRMS